jgi:hypothetical protein
MKARLLYLGWLQEEDKVHAKSLQPYLSAINQAHVDFGFPPPAVGQLVRLAHRGFGEVEGETLAAVRRVPLPASVALRILRLGLDTPSVQTIRACACLVVQFLWFARADTGIHLRDGHVGIGEFGVTLTERTKTISRHLAAPVTRPFHACWDPDGLILRILRRWLSVRGLVSQDAYFWAPPGEAPVAAWTSSSLINGWLQEILSTLGVMPPLGCAWTSHSLRSGGGFCCFCSWCGPACDHELGFVVSPGSDNGDPLYGIIYCRRL